MIKTNKNFDVGNIRYQNITPNDIENLRLFIIEELEKYPFGENGRDRMTICKMKKKDIRFNSDGLEYCYIKVYSYYFKDREAISFNRDMFVGFCGWASDKNRTPFHNAFEKWVTYTNNLKNDRARA